MKNQTFDNIRVEPDEKEIITFGAPESLDYDRCLKVKITMNPIISKQ